MKASREIALLRAKLDELLGGVGEQTFIYQAANEQTGLVVSFRVFRPTGVEDTAQGGIAEEVETTGWYQGSFTACGRGWFVLIDDNVGGHAVEKF